MVGSITLKPIKGMLHTNNDFSTGETIAVGNVKFLHKQELKNVL
jgi:hypothetical protein